MRLRKMITNKTQFIVLLCATVLAVVGCEVSADTATEEQSNIPRTPSGRPDFNGIWQALGNAHWDIEPHMAGIVSHSPQ